MTARLIHGPDGLARCFWCGTDPLYVHYHDHEWGRPVSDDRRIFEKISLEGFQSGLSWFTILKKRENFRAAFEGFDFERVARFNARKVSALLTNAGIVRHRGKIESTINNAKQACDMVGRGGSLAQFVWSFEPQAKDRPKRVTWDALMKMNATPASTALSKALKKAGWTFVGPTTMYAAMQAMGVVNDHLETCHARPHVEHARASFKRPF